MLHSVMSSAWSNGLIVDGMNLWAGGVHFFRTMPKPGDRGTCYVAPHIIFNANGIPVLAAGSPSVGLIPNCVTNALNILEFGMDIETSVHRPRIGGPTYGPDSLAPDAFSLEVDCGTPAIHAEVRKRGLKMELVNPWNFHSGSYEGVHIAADGLASACADPRRAGAGRGGLTGAGAHPTESRTKIIGAAPQCRRHLRSSRMDNAWPIWPLVTGRFSARSRRSARSPRAFPRRPSSCCARRPSTPSAARRGRALAQTELAAIDPAVARACRIGATYGLLDHEFRLLVEMVDSGAHLRPTLYPLGPEFTLIYWANSTALATPLTRGAILPGSRRPRSRLRPSRRACQGIAAGMSYPRLVVERAIRNPRPNVDADRGQRLLGPLARIASRAVRWEPSPVEGRALVEAWCARFPRLCRLS